MITRIEVYRYRCFAKMVADFNEYNVIAGVNGSGKSTLLDIPALVGDLLRSKPCSQAFLEPQASWGTPRAHTLTELIHKGRGDDLVFAIEAKLPSEVISLLTEDSSGFVKEHEELWPTHLRYELRLQVFNRLDLHVVNEYLYLYPVKQRPHAGLADELQGTPHRLPKTRPPVLRKKYWRSIVHREGGESSMFSPETIEKPTPIATRVPPTQLALSAVSPDRHDFPAANWLRDLLENRVVFLAPVWDRLRQASRPGYGLRLTPSAESIPWLALDLRQKAPDRYDRWVRHVQTALRQIEAIEAIEREEDHHAYFRVRYRGGYEVTSSGLSEGTVRILALTIIPYLTDQPDHLVIEQPEDGVHPRAIESVLQSLSSVYDSQVWVSTQSPLVLAHSELKDVLCTRIADDGSAEVIRGIDHPRLKDWKGSVDLGTLFAAGVLA